MDNILEVKKLSVQFKNSKGLFDRPVIKQVLKDVSFELRRGEILGLVGESGSGKSTIAKACLGLVDYSGSIIHHSEHPQMVFQDPYSSLNPSKRVGWLFGEAIYLSGIKDKQIQRSEADRIMKLVGLEPELINRYPSELSGGQRQRVCIGLALVRRPELLMADEPVSALDVTIQAQVLALLKELHSSMGLSMLFISHDLRVVYNLCDRVMILRGGRIVEQGPVKEVYGAPKDEYTRELLNAAFS